LIAGVGIGKRSSVRVSLSLYYLRHPSGRRQRRSTATTRYAILSLSLSPPPHPSTQPTNTHNNRLRLDPKKLGDFTGADLGRLILGLAKLKHPVCFLYFVFVFVFGWLVGD
jgi:hypothetical protein